MIKKRTAVAALAACIALSATFAGCSQISTDNKLDMEQVIARVDIFKADNFPERLSAYSSAAGTADILKRDLVSAYISYGYSNAGSSSSAEIFNSLVDSLVSNAVVTQYCIIELLADKAETQPDILSQYLACGDEISKYETLLGKDSDAVKIAQYSLYSFINSKLDGKEKTLIEEEKGYAGTDTRTTPTNLETEQDDYYPRKGNELDYNVYTGFEGYLLDQSGAYMDDAIEGTTRAFRRRAYDDYIQDLRTNYLIDESEENVADVLSLKATKTQYASYLKAQIVSEYNDLYEAELKEALKSGDSSYVQSVYDELLNSDKKLTSSDFESAMGEMSSSSFILYSPVTSDSEKFDGVNCGKFGFVYNILLPFDDFQSAELAVLTSVRTANEDDTAYYYGRNQLLKDIKTVDQRAAWFNGATDYSFKASEKGIESYGASDYLFFEGNLTDSGEGGRYKKLQAYDGRYSYNGKVYENEDESYTLIGNELDVDGMLAEFSAYINYVLGTESVMFDNGYDTVNGNQAFYNTGSPDSGTDFYETGSDKDIDYSNFLYASGKVNFRPDGFNRADLFNAETSQYKAMSAVNELQFAYTTDTSVLSQYVGYSVSAYDTSYIKEFEYAAKKAISEGAGAFTVCAGDYGWHLIYVTYTFEAGETYSPDWTNIDKEGTFENLFFDWLKTTGMSDATSRKSSQIISDFKKDSTVVKYQKRYQDLLDLG